MRSRMLSSTQLTVIVRAVARSQARRSRPSAASIAKSSRSRRASGPSPGLGTRTITTRDARSTDRFSSPWCGRASSCMSRSAHWWTRRASARRIIFSSAPRRRGMRSPTAFRNMKVTRPRRCADSPALNFRSTASGSTRLPPRISAAPFRQSDPAGWDRRCRRSSPAWRRTCR